MAIPKRDPDVWLEIGRDKLGQQLANVDAIDAKAGTFLATGSALIGVFVAVLAFRPPTAGVALVVVFVASLITYVILALATVLTLLPQGWGIGPDLDKEWNKHKGLPEHELRWRFASRYQKDFRENRERLRTKRAFLWASAIALFLQTILLGAGFFSLGRPA